MKKSSVIFNLAFSAVFVLLIMLFSSVEPVFAQVDKPALKTEIYQLENGLTVYLNPDLSLPKIFGAVAVKGGSKRDPSGATGIAHYFEHIMFKGTDKMGTLDYASEKVYLDSIAGLYDKLAQTSAEAEKLAFQKEINRLSVKASEYAIPNEIEKILGEMGCVNLNAGTGNDGIVYFNVLPSDQIQKWLEIYSHRFINPVYRLFQSELETVYEEYNMYSDNRFSTAFESFSAVFYPDHPYGIPVIGRPEHLKNPSMSEMNKYFETYYVANNMALVLSGNFEVEVVKPLINQYFGKWRSGKIPEPHASQQIKPFDGREEVIKKLTPIKFGLRGYRSVQQNHEDVPVLDVLDNLMSNQAQTGLLDELSVDNKLLQAQVFGDRRTDAGGEYILFMPKVLGQSLNKAEQLVEEKLNALKAGNFDDELLLAVKNELVVNYERNFEDLYSRGYLMISSFTSEMKWEDVLDYPEKVKKITKEDVLAAAKKYFGENYLAFLSKTGLPKKPSPLKPPYENIPSKNSGEKSQYAKIIEKMETTPEPPQFIEFGSPGLKTKDVTVTDINDLVHFYFVENKVNDLFSLTFSYGIGDYEMPVLGQVSQYLGLIGPKDVAFSDFKKQMQLLGGSLDFYSSWDNFTVSINGPESNFKQILELAAKFISNPAIDDSKIKNLYQNAKTNDKFSRKDPETLGYALFSYAVYGENSSFLKSLSSREIKNLKAASLVDAMKTAMSYESDVHFSGSLSLDQVRDIIRKTIDLSAVKNKTKAPVRQMYREYSQPIVFFLDDKSAIQSKDFFFVKGNTLSEKEKPLLNAYYEYLDGGMSSIIFQEIREFRSLAYATGANVFMPFYKDEEASLTSFVGTQADKTKEAIEVMHGIINKAPDKSDRIDLVRRSLVQSINSKKPTFRQISQPVANWVKQGYSSDPRKDWMKTYETMTFENIVDFYNSQFYQKPVITTIIGNKKRIGTDWMKEYGKIIEVSKDDILK